MKDGFNTGYIKIFRGIMNWGWYDDPNTFSLFLHLIIQANWKDDTYWHGEKVGRGEIITSVAKLAVECGLSIRETRTCLDRLVEGGEIDKQTTSKWTKITVCKYVDYQDSDDSERQTNDKRSTNQRQTNDKRTTTDEENKNTRIQEEKENNIKEKEKHFVPPTVEEVQSYADSIGFDLDAEHFVNYYTARGWELSKGRKVKDWKACVRTWRGNQKKTEEQDPGIFDQQSKQDTKKSTFTFIGTPRG